MGIRNIFQKCRYSLAHRQEHGCAEFNGLIRSIQRIRRYLAARLYYSAKSGNFPFASSPAGEERWSADGKRNDGLAAN